LEEVRRDDLNLDLLSQKDQRFPSKRERDRRVLLRERRQNKEKERERAHQNFPDKENADVLADVSTRTQHIAKASKNWERDAENYNFGNDDDFDDDEDGSRSGAQSLTFPGGLPAPTTPAARRTAAHAGGAVAAAIALAVSREVECQERERTREDREEQLERDRERKREMGVTASRGRTGARGKCGRPQLAVPSLETGQRPVGAAPEGKCSKGRSVPRQDPAQGYGVYDSRGRNSERRR